MATLRAGKDRTAGTETGGAPARAAGRRRSHANTHEVGERTADNLVKRANEILVRHYDIDADVAQALLARLSIQYHHTVSEVARQVIDRSSTAATENNVPAVRRRRQAATPQLSGSDEFDMMIAKLMPSVAGQARSKQSRQRSTYHDVPAMFREMSALPEGSLEWQRAREAIMNRCMPLAEHIAHRFKGRGEPNEDIAQVARLGLVNAINRFDVDTGTDFVAFAVPTIMGEVRRHFRDNSWAVKVPRRLKELHLQLGPTAAKLSQHLGRAPTPSELAAELGLDRAEVVETLIAGSGYNTLSIDRPRGGDGEMAPLAETVGSADANMDRIENREALRPLLEALPERERTVIVLRFFESLTQSQIADRIGVSQMHVSRLLARTLSKLREELQ